MRTAQILVSALLAFSGTTVAFDAFAESAPRCERVLKAEVVALEQAIVLNRYGAFNPAGTLFALRRDVVRHDSQPVTEQNFSSSPGQVQLRPDKRPRPLVLRMNEGDCLEVRFHNLLAPVAAEERLRGPEQYDGKVPTHLNQPPGTVDTSADAKARRLERADAISGDWPRTRAASFHVNGLEYVPVVASECPPSSADHEWVCGADGDDVGLNTGVVHPGTPADVRGRLERQGTLVHPGQSAVYRYRARREGTYFAYSTGATVGGEGDGGQIAIGLFGAVNVQPSGSKWYRSQVSHADLLAATSPATSGHPYRQIAYDTARYTQGPLAGTPILAMLDGDEIVHSDLNAVVVPLGKAPDHNDTTSAGRACTSYAFGNSCGRAYREFTVIMHDEVKAVQAFAELEDETNPLAGVRDNMGINYGVAGMGAMVVARNRKIGPVKNCPECRAEEFFLSSWANGDPALVLRWDAAGRKPVGAMYPDDPSNIHHSYLGDPVRFRNIHAGPKETHVFHLHAHQWQFDASDPGSTYLDSQTISPGATFSYEVAFGGSGNRNLAPGDSIFHCHLYPHFAQGMWELWRVHDVFEDGTPALYDPMRAPRGRNLPDAEVAGGIETPAIVPLPGTALPLMASAEFGGYPFYVAGEPGHRPPQPPLDFDQAGTPGEVNGGLPRHVLTSQGANTTKRALTETRLVNQDVVEEALAKGGDAARLNAAKVYRLNPNALHAFAEKWESIGGWKKLDSTGTAQEQVAMTFHEGALAAPGIVPATKKTPHDSWTQEDKAYRTDWSTTVAGQARPKGDALFYVNGRARASGAPFADPCPVGAPQRDYKAAFIQTELTVNRHGWFDPQARIIALEQDVQNVIDPDTRTVLPEPLFFRANSGDCIHFNSSNFVPNALALDDFQLYTPTDTIGQHIHLVKFDVTSSDGSGNGWNYEDATFSPEEVRERVFAINHAYAASGDPRRLTLKTHPLFQQSCPPGEAQDGPCMKLKELGTCPPGAHLMDPVKLSEDHPYCGAQRTTQRWYADPIFDRAKPNPVKDKDLTLRTVFTHDHMGPSSHQQHGLYAALVVEPANSVWLTLDSAALDWSKLCAGTPAEQAAERGKVIGGANLSAEFDARCRKFAKASPVKPKELRPPLVLRDDGGPTATRANIIAPLCARKDSNPLDPGFKRNPCGPTEFAQTRREFAVAIADFSILYDTSLEPINPEERDESALFRGRRQVALQLPNPLAISLEDPGSQLVNYRHEPFPLRIADAKPNPVLGGFDYQQTRCAVGDASCTGDPANFFSSAAHADRDRRIATAAQAVIVSPATRAVLAAQGMGGLLDATLVKIQAWRKEFNCALYPASELWVNCRIRNAEPWRKLGDPATPILPAYEGDPVQIRLIQGAQEAQHVFHVNGAKWRREPGSLNSGWLSAQPLGISEHFEFDVDVNPLGVRRTDYLYGGSSVDQVWDGQWGLLRAYGRDGDQEGQPLVDQSGVARLTSLKGSPVRQPPVPSDASAMNGTEKVCDTGDPMVEFDVAAVRACEVTGTCGAVAGGLVYNTRLGMHDPNAIVYLDYARVAGATSKQDDNATALQRLIAHYQGKALEPLVLRAPAGACMRVQLRNLLPRELRDGPNVADSAGNATTTHFGHNYMSMITDGFNYNQFRMSSSIGLSAPLVAQVLQRSDGSNIGMNGAEIASGDPDVAATMPQGTLAPACRDGTAAPTGSLCTRTYTWWAGDFRLDAKGRRERRPVEFGAIPLRSFGDVIKHPGHGAVGALVIGPVGSKQCSSVNALERAADEVSALSATICDATGKPLYRDFVAVLQDAVDAAQDGRAVPNLSGAEEPDDYGVKAFNYRTEPVWGRRGGDPSISFEERTEFDYAHVLSSKRDASGRCISGVTLLPRGIVRTECDPETSIFVAEQGREVRLRVVHPGGHTRQQAITVHGHDWTPTPWTKASSRLALTSGAALKDSWIVQGSYNGVGPMMAANLLFKAGGEFSLPMDYLLHSQASFLFDGGIWGLIRVVPPGAVATPSH